MTEAALTPRSAEMVGSAILTMELSSADISTPIRMAAAAIPAGNVEAFFVGGGGCAG